MARLAFLSPWPPQPSGIATVAADLVPRLAEAGHGVDVLVDEALVSVPRGPDGPPRPGQVRVLGAHDLVWRMARGQYDLPIYQVGNSWAHGFIWPYLFRYPGLAVLHDARVHHARATSLLLRKRHDDYRAEFKYNHPDVSGDAAELAIAGFDGLYYYQWPMRRAILDGSRLVATHSPGASRELNQDDGDDRCVTLALGHGRVRTSDELAAARHRFRTAAGIPERALLFGVLGHIAQERRIAQVARAFASVLPWAPEARLLLVGQVDPLLDLDALLDAAGIRAATHLVGRTNDEQFDDAIASLDVGLNLRWPSALETSGPWLRMLAAGVTTVVIDAAHQVEAPAVDPRTWHLHEPPPSLRPRPEDHAVTVAVDILDEDHSLRLALRRLATDSDLRTRLGANARAYWQANHTIERMAQDYLRVIPMALARPAPSPTLPAHLRPDVTAYTSSLVRDIVEIEGLRD